MRKKSSGWLVLAFFATIPLFMIAVGLVLAFSVSTTSRQITIGDQEPLIEYQYHRGSSAPTTREGQDNTESKNPADQESRPSGKSDTNSESVKPDADKETSKGNAGSNKSDGNGNGVGNKKSKAKKTAKKKAPPVTTVSNSKPDWVLDESERTHSAGKLILIETGIQAPDDVDAAIDKEAMQRVRDYVRTQFGNDCADRVTIELKHIQTNLVRRRHREVLNRAQIRELFDNDPSLSTLDYEYGYAEIEFDEDFDSLVYSRWQREKRSSRLVQMLLVVGSVFTLMVIGFSFFSTDRATRGMYTVRLQLGALLLIVVSGIVFWFAATSFSWL